MSRLRSTNPISGITRSQIAYSGIASSSNSHHRIRQLCQSDSKFAWSSVRFLATLWNLWTFIWNN